jgi:tetratricopeptide (TPR) repeat protein
MIMSTSLPLPWWGVVLRPVGIMVQAFGGMVGTTSRPRPTSSPSSLMFRSASSSSSTRRQKVLMEMTIPTLEQEQQDDDDDNDDDDDPSSSSSYNEEALSVIFQRAVVLQQSGLSPQQALDEYDFFLKAAHQLQRRQQRRSSSSSSGGDNENSGGIIEPFMMAEVYGNQGALYLKLRQYELAKRQLERALTVRPTFGTAHVNLAICELQQLSLATPTTTMVDPEGGPPPPSINHHRIQQAEFHCQKALECNTDPRSVAMAKKLLHDIDEMKKQK